MTKIQMVVNGRKVDADVEPRKLLIDFIREDLGFTGPHIGCDTSNCGACTILLNGRAIKSCTMFAVQADGMEILTIEGISTNGKLHPLQQAFHENHALQCGYCTPGMIMSSIDLLSRNPDPTEEEIRLGISGNLCRCTGYHNIVKAISSVAKSHIFVNPARKEEGD